MTAPSALIDPIRAASRRLVRELGFMGGAFAGTDLTPSAVHALIEIDAAAGISARDLGRLLRLEKSSVSRMLRKLVLSGDVVETPDGADGRAKMLSLGVAGQRRVGAIHAFARARVAAALARLAPDQRQTVLAGLRFYAQALEGPAKTDGAALVEIGAGYRPGLIAEVTGMHARYYARESGFGQHFESVVAAGLAEFCDRLDQPGNQIWTATLDGDIVGAIAIDGQDLGPGIAHLRWFITDDGARGMGIGRRLLDTALAFADANATGETHLWTFDGLPAARHLYECAGFVLAEQRPGRQWGAEVLEQRLVRHRR